MGGCSVGASRRVSVVRWEKARSWRAGGCCAHLPSWGELARGEADLLRDILGARRGEEELPPKLDAWMADLRAEYEKVRASSEALLARARRLS